VRSSANPLVRSLVTEWAVLRQEWCKMLQWDDPWPNTQDFLVRLFTGPGLHPTAGIIVPESGIAAGMALNVPWNESPPGYGRFATSLEGRASENGFWEIGAKLQTLFPAHLDGLNAPQFTLIAWHLELPRLPFYGIGNATSRHDRTLYGLKETAISPRLDVSLPLGFTLSGELAGLWFVPDGSASFAGMHSEATAPGFRARTGYLRPLASAVWKYPRAETLYGFSTSAAVSYARYEALGGGPYSFDRLDARWNVAFASDPAVGTVRFVSHLVLSDPSAGNRVPFYLQPTLGGADIHDENLLRGYNNYRFTAPNLIAYEVSYERKIIDPVGLRLFAELGRVGRRASELGFDGLKSSVGFSLTFRLGGASVAELSFAWSGGREGMHVYATGNTNNVGGLTAGLRGVF
jgi:hypothetical protein